MYIQHVALKIAATLALSLPTTVFGSFKAFLNDLSKRGLVISYKKEGRKYFKITKRGKTVLRAIDELKTLL